MQIHDNDSLPLSEVEQIFSGLAFGIDASMWLSGREMFFNNSDPLRARTRFALGHYFFFGDPTCSMPALGYGLDKEREWVIKQILIERQGLINEPPAVFARRWRQRAGECVPITVDSISTQQLKASIIACCAYAAMPPSAEDATKIQRLIDELRKELGRRITGPKRKKEDADGKLTVR